MIKSIILITLAMTSIMFPARTAAFSWHQNYCVAAHGDIHPPSGPIFCEADGYHLDEECVAHARENYIATVRNSYQIACDFARQYQHEHDLAVIACHGDQTCIGQADALLETSLTSLDSSVTGAINTAIALYWQEVSYCCIPD